MAQTTIIYVGQFRCTIAATGSPGLSAAAMPEVIAAFDAVVPPWPQRAEDLLDFGARLLEQVKGRRYGSVRLVIPASWCLMHGVQFPDERWSRKAAQFEVEPFFPIDLDQLTVAVDQTHRRGAIVVGVCTAALAGLLEVLERGGLAVESVLVDALLLRRRCKPSTMALIDCHSTCVISQDPENDGVDVRILRHNAKATAGSHGATGALPESPGRYIHVFLTSNAQPWAGHNSAGNAHEVQVNDAEQTLQAILTAASNDTEALNLRCEQLRYHGRWNALYQSILRTAVAAGLFLAIAAFSARIESHRYASAAEALRPAMAESYQQVWPGAELPPEAALRLRSEVIRLEALTGRRPRGESARGVGLYLLERLSAMIQVLPPDARLDLHELSLDERTIKLAGRTTSHTVAGSLVQALNSGTDLTTEPPRTKLRKDGTVDFHVLARSEGNEHRE